MLLIGMLGSLFYLTARSTRAPAASAMSPVLYH